MAEPLFHADDFTSEFLAKQEAEKHDRETARVVAKATARTELREAILNISSEMASLFACTNQDDFTIANARVQGLLDDLKINCSAVAAHLPAE